VNREDRDPVAASVGIPAPRHRLPGGIGLGPVRLQVADLERSLAFYQDVLGFRIHSSGTDGSRGEDPVAALGVEEGSQPLVILRERKGAHPVPRRGRLGLFHFAILQPDREALGRFAAHLGELGFPFGASDHRVSEALYLRDPDGLGVEVYADRPRSDWEQEDRQVVMSTDPLDVEGLIRDAGDGGWHGMPAGTRMGHIHLHVGDLGRAEAFYHRALGLDQMVWSYPGALFLAAGGYHHHLGVNTWAVGALPAGDDDARLLEWELQVPDPSDLSRTAESLEDAGSQVEVGSGWARVRDPWDTALRIRASGAAG
jgi:catechol 2,3-dioxygenase